MKALLPLLVPLIKLLGAALGIVAGILVKVVEAVVGVVKWFANLIGTVGDLLAKLGPLRAVGDFIGGIVGGKSVAAPPGAPGVGLRGATPLAPSGGSSVAGGIVINITGDG